MVLSKPACGFEKMVKDYPLMTSFELLPFIGPYELVYLCRLNKASYKIMKSVVNFKLLFEKQGIKLKPAEAEEIKKSTFTALHVAVKRMILDSIIYSKRFIPLNVVNLVSSTMSFSDDQNLAQKSFKELSNLAIEKV